VKESVIVCVISEQKKRQCEKVSGRRGRGEELLCYCAAVRGLPCCLAMPCLNASPPSTYHERPVAPTRLLSLNGLLLRRGTSTHRSRRATGAC
jgi:hypothetical protein